MVMNSHQLQPANRRPAAGTTGEVVRSDATGVWVAPVPGDTRHPVGPCRGATRPTLTGSGEDLAIAWEQLPAGTAVLLVLTEDGPWVAAHHQTDEEA